jgi:hypothetical protein
MLEIACSHSALILPFYALLDDADQKKVFNCDGEQRKIVVATNVAETSVTIPGISYVVDSGRAKEKVYRGVGAGLLTRYDIVWVSKASAEQRSGRAGRTGPGHCYRLYSSAVYNNEFRSFREAEIRRVPADMVVLRLRSMGIRHVLDFPFPTKPDAKDVADAELLLSNLGALDRTMKWNTHKETRLGRNSTEAKADSVLGVTPIGFMLAKLPVPPRFGRMMLAANSVRGCLPYAARVAALLSLGDVLRQTPTSRKQHALFRHPLSDVLTQLRALCAVEHTGYAAICSDAGDLDENISFHRLTPGTPTSAVAACEKAREDAMRNMCEEYAINFKTCVEALAIADQLEQTIGSVVGGNLADEGLDRRKCGLPPMTDVQETCLLRSLLSGFPDRVARRMTLEEAALSGVIPRRRKVAFTVSSFEESPAFLDTCSSVHLEAENEFVCYADMLQVCEPTGGQCTQDRTHHGDHDDYDDIEGPCLSDPGEDLFARQTPSNLVSFSGPERRRAAQPDIPASRLVLRNVSVVQSRWLAVDAAGMCKHVIPEGGRSLRYESSMDSFSHVVEAKYGPRQWSLGHVSIGLEHVDESSDHTEEAMHAMYCAFGTALLQGRVFAELRAFADKLCGNALDVSGPAGGRRALELVGALARTAVRSRRALVKVWMEPGRDKFLCNEYLAWVRERHRTDAAVVWKDMVKSHVDDARRLWVSDGRRPCAAQFEQEEDEDDF